MKSVAAKGEGPSKVESNLYLGQSLLLKTPSAPKPAESAFRNSLQALGFERTGIISRTWDRKSIDLWLEKNTDKKQQAFAADVFVGLLESSYLQNPAHSYEMADIYNVQLIASNPGGCSDSITKKISVSPYDFIKLPSAFSPNGDGKNETFRILNAGNIELIEFKIFNRWGNLVFETNNKEEAWDGKRRGEYQNSGTYIYYIKGRKSSGEITEIKGNFTLLR